jgi:hypothetical protein
MVMTKRDLVAEHQWLRYAWTTAAYLPPEYYRKLLKPYSFSGKKDLDMFEGFLRSIPEPATTLELGAGEGRGTEVFCRVFGNRVGLDTLDTCGRMLARLAERLPNLEHHAQIVSDSINYLASTNKSYDLVYALWTLSHSIHRHLSDADDEPAESERCVQILMKFLTENLNPGGHLYVIHYDSQSEEQTIVVRQRTKFDSFMGRWIEVSPSLQIVTRSLSRLKAKGVLDYSIEHRVGDAIVYKNMEEALETFMNFHLEGEVNQRPDLLEGALAEVETYLLPFTRADGTLAVRPGCYTIEVTRSQSS